MKYLIKTTTAFLAIILFNNHIMAQTEKKVSVRNLSVNVEVIGSLAFTRYDMTIHNPNGRQMEYQLTLPMSPDEEVVEYYLDIDGRMRSAVVVDKDKARTTFEEVVNRRIDPGLVEKVEGNNYRLRVYPVPAHGTRRTIIVTQQQLPLSGNEYVYALTGGLNARYETFALGVDVYKDFVKPEVKTGSLDNFTFTKGADRYSAAVEKKNFTYDKPLVFTIPLSSTVESLVVAASAEESWFYAVLPQLGGFKAKSVGKPLTIVWDCSLSGLNRDNEREIAFLKAYLANAAPSSLELYTFNDKLSAPVEIKSPEALLERIKAIVYDGRSDISTLAALKNSGGNILIFSDGVSSLGEKAPKLDADAVAVTSGSACDFDALKALGARHVDLNTSKIEDAVNSACRNAVRIKNIRATAGHVVDISAEKGDLIDDIRAICGKMKGTAIRLSVELTDGKIVEIAAKGDATGAGNNVSVVLSGTEGRAYGLDLLTPFPFERLLAAQQIKRLSAQGEAQNKARIVELATQAGVVTRYTSLLVLEDIGDYVRYEITPPKELQTNDYYRLLDKHQKSKAQAEVPAPDSIVADDFNTYYKSVIDWWNTKFDKKKTPVKRKTSMASMMRNPFYGVTPGVETSPNAVVSEESTEQAEVLHMTASATSDLTQDEMSMGNEDSGAAGNSVTRGIELNPYTPDEPYLKILEKAPQDKLYQTYLLLREGYLYQPMFYIDVADLLLKRGMKPLAEQVLGNIVEITNQNSQMVQNYGQKLVEYQLLPEAIRAFEYLAAIRPEHPQPLRDLALALEYDAQYQKALDTFNSILTRRWNRFDEIKPVVFVELNSLVARHKEVLDLSKIDKRLVYAMPIDNRVVISWGTDNCDIDLHVKEPNGEVCYYAHRLTGCGGSCSQDFTDGFGPEEYKIREASPGEYKIMVNNFANRTQGEAMPVMVYVDIFADYGLSTQVRRRIVVRVENVHGDLFDIGTFRKQ